MGQKAANETPTSPWDLEAGPGFYNYDVQTGRARGCRRLAGYFGVSPETCARGLPLQDFMAAIHREDRDRVTRAIQTTMEIGGAFDERYRTVIPGGSCLHVHASGFCFRDEAGRPETFVGAVEPVGYGHSAKIDRTIEYTLAAYRLANTMRKPLAQYLIALALEDMGFALPRAPTN